LLFAFVEFQVDVITTLTLLMMNLFYGVKTRRGTRRKTREIRLEMELTRMKHNHSGAATLSNRSSNNNNTEAHRRLCSHIFVLLQIFLVAATASATTAPSTYGFGSSSSSSSGPCSFVVHSSCNKVVVPSEVFDVRSRLFAARGGAAASPNDDSVSNGGGGEDDEEVFYNAVQEEEKDEEAGGGSKADEAATTEQKEGDEQGMPPVVEEQQDEEPDDSGMKWDAGEVDVPGDTTAEVISEEEEHSSANVDKMDYADAYDDDEEQEGGGGGGGETSSNVATGGGGETPDGGSSDGSVPDVEEDAAKNKNDESSAMMISLASEISSEMKRVLIQELAYRRVDVQAMRPEIAAMVIAKKIRKPMEGLPRNWYIDENSAVAWRSRLQHALLGGRFAAAPVIAILLGAVIVSGRTNLLDGMSLGQIFPSRRQKASSSLLPTFPETTAEDSQDDVLGQDDMMVGSTANSNEGVTASSGTTSTSSVVGAAGDSIAHEHSVRPGEKPSPEPIDETGLDRALTVITKMFSAIFQKKL
jgi:hypothetical protein